MVFFFLLKWTCCAFTLNRTQKSQCVNWQSSLRTNGINMKFSMLKSISAVANVWFESFIKCLNAGESPSQLAQLAMVFYKATKRSGFQVCDWLLPRLIPLMVEILQHEMREVCSDIYWSTFKAVSWKAFWMQELNLNEMSLTIQLARDSNKLTTNSSWWSHCSHGHGFFALISGNKLCVECICPPITVRHNKVIYN